MRFDFARYVILYKFGGLYADIDVEPIKKFDRLLRAYEAFLSSEPDAHSYFLNGQNSTPCNALMGSMPGHPFWRLFIENVIERSSTVTDPVDLTGPRGLTQFMSTYASEGSVSSVEVLPDYFFMPYIATYQADKMRSSCSNNFVLSEAAAKVCATLRRNGFRGKEIGPDTYSIHHWSCSWCQPNPFSIGE
jgi:hypothetical protein